MSELSQTIDNPRFIRVSKSVEIFDGLPVVTSVAESVPDENTREFFKEKRGLNSLYNSYIDEKMRGQKLSEKLEYSERLAKRTVKEIRSKIGLPEIDDDKMRCLYVSDLDYAKDFENSGDFYGLKDTDGLHNIYFNAELARTRDYPDYVVAAISAHEWIHRFVDVQVVVYKEKSTSDVAIIQSEHARSGISVRD